MSDEEKYLCLECFRYDPAEDMCEIHYWIDPYEQACGLFIPDDMQ